MDKLFSSPLLFWAGWVILPIIVEFIPAVYNFILLLVKKVEIDTKRQEIKFLPPVSVIIPVYNSGKTLKNCIASVANSHYDISVIDVLCVDNGSKDNSFEIFQQCQIDFPDLAINWMTSAQGKSNALNMAIYNCEGKYVVNIDSDGVLERESLYNLVRKFENNPDCNCMTGAVLIEPRLVEEERKRAGFILRLIQKVEFMEYCQAFLAGRNFQAETNSIFTMSGAYSAFRKSTILKTRLYNSETICEDTQMTFQVKENLKQKVYFCEDALFFVDPIESVNKLYTQRQRWQIGELEVMQMFVMKKMKNPVNIVKDATTRLLAFDHTMAFPKIAWVFVLLIISFANRSASVAVISMGIIYFLGIITSCLFGINTICFLKEFPEIRRYYKRNFAYIILMPLYSYFTYFIRLCGILNSIGRASTWKTKNFTEEKTEIKDQMHVDFTVFRNVRDFFRKVLEMQVVS